ncbi:MAG: bacillithiol biosynthesis cysteine-adding enzyme BshC [Longimicrobiales bacterium]
MTDPTVNLEFLVGRPTGAAVVAGYLAGADTAMPFYGRHFERLDAYREKAAEVDGRFDREARAVAARILRVPDRGDPARLERFVEEGGYMVTTGQQPGLFGGPLYSIYKAMTAVALARRLETALERPVVPVFWVASEDHDWAEANHTWVVGVDNELHRLAVEAPDPSVHPALHRVPLGDDARAAARAMVDALPETDFSPRFVDLIERAGTPGRTLPEGFHLILQDLLGDTGLVFADAADRGLKEASLPTLLDELARSAETEAVLVATGERLEKAGYAHQVTLMEGGVNLFLSGPAGRERLYREDGGFRLRTSGEHLSEDDVRARAAADPTVLTPNVLLRPVVESAILPTLSYVGGPGELAYFAQLRDYFDAFGVGMPVVHPRCSVTVVESKIRKVLDKFGLDVPDLARPFHEISSDIARDEVPPDVKRALGSLKGAVAKGVADLEKEVKAIDPTLKGPVQHIRSQAFQALDEAEKKVVHALKREKEIALAQLEKAQLHLFPDGVPQERAMNAFYYLSRYGGAFLDALAERFEVNPE